MADDDIAEPVHGVGEFGHVSFELGHVSFELADLLGVLMLEVFDGAEPLRALYQHVGIRLEIAFDALETFFGCQSMIPF